MAAEAGLLQLNMLVHGIAAASVALCSSHGEHCIAQSRMLHIAPDAMYSTQLARAESRASPIQESSKTMRLPRVGASLSEPDQVGFIGKEVPAPEPPSHIKDLTIRTKKQGSNAPKFFAFPGPFPSPVPALNLEAQLQQS